MKLQDASRITPNLLLTYVLLTLSIKLSSYRLSDHSLIYCLEERSLSQLPWHVALNNHEDIDDCVHTWSKLFSKVAEGHASIRTSRARGFSIPWLNPHITQLMNQHNYHLKKAKGNKCSTHWRLYRDLRNKSHPNHRESRIRLLH